MTKLRVYMIWRSLVIWLSAFCLVAVKGYGATNPGMPPNAHSLVAAPQEIQSAAIEQLQHQHHYTSRTALTYLLNIKCLLGTFTSMAAFGVPLDHKLTEYSTDQPFSSIKGGRKAALKSQNIAVLLEECAHTLSGHVRLIRETVGDEAPACPKIDIGFAFTEFINKAAGHHTSIGFDAYASDLNVLLSLFILADIDATASQGAILMTAYNIAAHKSDTQGNLTEVAVAAGLAGASSQTASLVRWQLWQRRKTIIPNLDLSVETLVDKISKLRQSLSGEFKVDQGLKHQGLILNAIPTDGNGASYSRTPQQVLNVLTLGSSDANSNRGGGFFPEGVVGAIEGSEIGPLTPAVPSILLETANAPYVLVYHPGDVDVTEPVVRQLGNRLWRQVVKAFGGMVNGEL